MPWKFDRHCADDNDAAPVGTHFQCLSARRGRFCSSRHDDTIRTTAVGQRADLPCRIGREHTFRAEPRRQLHTFWPQVDANDPTTLKPRKLRDELPHDPEADNNNGLTESDCGDAHRLHRDAAEGGEGSVLDRHLRRHRHDEVASGDDRLAMPRTLAAKGDHLAWLDVHHASIDGRHPAGARVAEHGVFAELRLDFCDRPSRAIGLHRRRDLVQMRRIVPQFRQHTLLVQTRRFRAAAD